jgi:hypothetical protein
MSSTSNIMPPFSSPSVADRWFRVLLLRRFIVFFYNNDSPSGLSDGNMIEYQHKKIPKGCHFYNKTAYITSYRTPKA